MDYEPTIGLLPKSLLSESKLSGGNSRPSRYYKLEGYLGFRPAKVSQLPPQNARKHTIRPTALKILLRSAASARAAAAARTGPVT